MRVDLVAGCSSLGVLVTRRDVLAWQTAGVDEATRVQVLAQIEVWRQDIAENRRAARGGKREGTAEGRDLYRYHSGYADALDRGVQALEMIAG